MEDVASLVTRYEALSELFDQVVHRGRPLSDRVPVTEALEALFDDLIAVVRPDTIVEIGAFEAAFSRRAKARYPDARVMAFEANPRVHAVFSEAVAAAGVEYIPKAVGEATGMARFFIPETIAGSAMPFVGRMGSLHQVGLRDSTTVEVEVEVTTLDDVMSTRSGESICLWVDVEGAVDKVLAGGRRTLESTTLLFCELESAPVWTSQALSGAVLATLHDAGFIPVARDCQKWFQFNALFVKAERWDETTMRPMVDAYAERASQLFQK